MKKSGKLSVRISLLAVGLILCSGLASLAAKPKPITAGEKAKAEGMIQARHGDLISIKQNKTGDTIVVVLSDATKFERDTSWGRHADMDVTAMLPGLTIKAEGVGDAKGQLDASKISFNPDTFAIEVAEEKQIQANAAAAGKAQATADKGVANAANAQASADAAGATAVAAGAVAVMDAEAIALVNQRVSDLGEYNMIGEGSLYFDSGKAALTSADKLVLDDLAKVAKTLDNYMLEIAGYASSTGAKAANQKLSDDRATAVAQYLRNTGSIPMRRILAPAGYGATHPAATNKDAQGREINRRVDVKVLVNKGLSEGM